MEKERICQGMALFDSELGGDFSTDKNWPCTTPDSSEVSLWACRNECVQNLGSLDAFRKLLLCDMSITHLEHLWWNQQVNPNHATSSHSQVIAGVLAFQAPDCSSSNIPKTRRYPKRKMRREGFSTPWMWCVITGGRS